MTEDDDREPCARCGEPSVQTDEYGQPWCARHVDDQEPTVAQLEWLSYGHWWA